MQVTNGRGYQVEYCAACGYVHKTYFREPTEEELTDDAFRFGSMPFIDMHMSLKIPDGVAFNQNTGVYVCPRCGIFHILAPLAD